MSKKPTPEDYETLQELDPPPMPPRYAGRKNEYYVHESEMWEDTMHLYETGEFPERLANSLMMMTDRMVNTWDRFRKYDELTRDEMQSRAIAHVTKKLMEKKFNPKHGSKVYSWCTRVIMNECLQVANKENRRREKMKEIAEYMDVCEGKNKVKQ